MNMSTYLEILRDIYVISIASVTHSKLEEYINEHCQGCKLMRDGPPCDRKMYKHDMYHDLCGTWQWEIVIIERLAKILERLQPIEITNALSVTMQSAADEVPGKMNYLKTHHKEICSALQLMEDEMEEKMQYLKTNPKRGFSLTTFIYICAKDMCTDVHLQTRIAEAVYVYPEKIYEWIRPQDAYSIRHFKWKYYDACKKKIDAKDRSKPVQILRRQ